MRNNRRKEGVVNITGHAKSSWKQNRLVIRVVRETFTTPKEDHVYLHQ